MANPGVNNTTPPNIGQRHLLPVCGTRRTPVVPSTLVAVTPEHTRRQLCVVAPGVLVLGQPRRTLTFLATSAAATTHAATHGHAAHRIAAHRVGPLRTRSASTP